MNNLDIFNCKDCLYSKKVKNNFPGENNKSKYYYLCRYNHNIIQKSPRIFERNENGKAISCFDYVPDVIYPQ